VSKQTNISLYLGVDIGSSGVKAMLLSLDKKIIAEATVSIDLHSRRPGWAEAESNDWWKALRSLVPELLMKANEAASSIKAVAISGMVPAVLFLDEKKSSLRSAILQNDARAVTEIDELRESLSNFNVLEKTGSVLSQQSVAPTVLWISRHEPEVWGSTRYVVGSYDWMAIALGAEVHVEANWAMESGLYGFDRLPLQEVQDATHLTWTPLSVVKIPGTVVGVVSTAAAAATGLARGTKIVVGGADHVLSAYGAGLINNGDCLVKLGGACDILAVSDEKLLDPRLYLDIHPAPDKWLPNGCMATSGSLLRWEEKIFENVTLASLDQLARESKPGSLLALPYFLGEKTPLHDASLRGVIAGLHLGTTRGDLHRSFLEAIAYGVRHHFEVFAECGLKLNSPRITNGGSKSTLWKEIMADVLDLELIPIIGHPGASFAAAIIAAIGVGDFHDWSIVTGWLMQGESITPNSKNRVIYNERYLEYRELHLRTEDISHSLVRGSQ